MILYGIADCDTVNKARKALDAAGVAHAFHDYKKVGVDEATLRAWVDRYGWERLLNRAGTTFRKLPDTEKDRIDAERAIALMIAHPSAIKRPVLVTDDAVIIGYDPERYAALA